MDTLVRNERSIVATYNYCGEDGRLLYQKVRYNPKGFSWRRVSPLAEGGWEYGLGDGPKVPYRLPELLNPANSSRPVFMVEGEKDVETLRGLGLLATSSKDWLPEWSHYLAGRTVVLIPDNDLPGKLIAKRCSSALKGVAGHIFWIELPGLSKGGDVSDWLHHHTREDFSNYIDEQLTRYALHEMGEDGDEGKPRPDGNGDGDRAERLAQVELPKVLAVEELLSQEQAVPNWTVEDMAITPGLAILGGAAKVGKSYFLLNLAVAISTGLPFLGQRKTQAAGVLVMSLESTPARDQGRIRALLEAYGRGSPELLPKDLHLAWRWNALDEQSGGIYQLEKYLETNPQTKVVIIDILEAVRPAKKGGSDAYSNDYAFLNPLRQLAYDKGLLIILSTHTNKGSWENPYDALQSSTGVQGASTLNMVLGKKEGRYYLQFRGNEVPEQRLHLSFEAGLFQEVPDSAEGKDGFSWDDEKEPALGEFAAQVLAALERVGEPVSVPYLLGELNLLPVDRTRLANALHRLVKAGKVERMGRGYYTLA